MPRGFFLTEAVSNSPEETFALGRRVSSFLGPGSVVALRGELGSGKTHLAKGIAGGLGVSENITSPTYTIISEYKTENSSVLYHIDAYRLLNDEDFENIGGSEIIGGSGISVIEWSERIPSSLPGNAITIALEITGPSSRLIKIEGLPLL
jgi:tRNA threonylcarbamoyladenosine biosynthesis protein TsaE